MNEEQRESPQQDYWRKQMQEWLRSDSEDQKPGETGGREFTPQTDTSPPWPRVVPGL